MSLPDEVASGDIRRGLVALRDTLAERLATCQRADAVAPIAKALADVIEKLEALPDAGRKSAVDDLSQRRKDRREKAAGL